MSDKSNIEWTDATWNPVVGCSIVSPGCTNCYAMKMAARLEAMGQPIYAGMTKKVNGNVVWSGKVEQSNWGQVIKPLSWKRPRRVFVNSMSDLFHRDLPDESLDRCFAVMGVADQHEYQVLTKRIDRAAEYLLTPLRIEEIYARWNDVSGSPREMQSWPMRHVLIGVSVEDQTRANERRSFLKDIADAGWRTFVSYEPALGAVDWSGWEFLSWMISGGESGPKARPTHTDWHRSTRDWCASNEVPYLFKQWGEWLGITEMRRRPDGGGPGFGAYDHCLYDQRNQAIRVGKKAAGRLLDGVEHNGFPVRGSP